MKTATITRVARPMDPSFAEVMIEIAGSDRSYYEASTRPRRDGTPLSYNYIVGWTDGQADPTASARLEAAYAATLADGETRTVTFGAPDVPVVDEVGEPDLPRDRAFDRLYNEGGEGYNPGRRSRR